jgi:hypothetical protein
MKTRLENQIAIVTGSSSGNGRAIDKAMADSIDLKILKSYYYYGAASEILV